MKSVKKYHPADRLGALHGGELRMLVVEDEPDVASTLKTMLEKDFGAVSTAAGLQLRATVGYVSRSR